MMPPRLSLRRLFCVVVLCGAGVVVLQNVRQNWYTSGTAQGGELPIQAQDQLRLVNTLDNNGHTTTTLAGGDVNSNNEVGGKEEILEVKERPWFMTGGTLRPKPAETDQ